MEFALIFSTNSLIFALCAWMLAVAVAQVDTRPPVITPIRVVEKALPMSLNAAGTRVSWVEPTAIDDSGIVSMTSRSHDPGSFFPIGTTIVTYVFTDGSGNSASMSFSVLVRELDNTPPVIRGMRDIRLEIPLGLGGTNVTWTEPTATDNSGIATFTSSSHDSGSYFPVGITTVSYIFSDPEGNQALKSFNVKIVEVDNIQPVISSSVNDITREVSLGNGGTRVSWVEPTATDNSGNVVRTRTNAPGNFFHLGTTTVTYTFTDPSGNQAMTSFDVNIQEVDILPPVISTIGDITHQISLGFGGTTVTWTEPTATDDSGDDISISKTHEPGDFFQVGTTTVTYIFTDSSGNQARTSFNVIVIEVDTTVPNITPVNDITIRLRPPVTLSYVTVTWSEPSATDDSGIVTLTYKSHNSGSYFPIGDTTVTYRYTDGSGNSASMSFHINIFQFDAIPPIIQDVPDDITVTIPLGMYGRRVTWVEPTATDNSGITPLLSRSTYPNAFFPIGTTPVTYTFTDPSDNQASATFNVNVATVDTEPPVIHDIPNDINVIAPFGYPGRWVSWIEPTAADNSGTATLVSRTKSPGSFFIVGTTQVTYKFADLSGNEATASFNVHVQSFLYG